MQLMDLYNLDNFEYISKVIDVLIKHHRHESISHQPYYYYQYEGDSNMSNYENMMHNNYIVIRATSYKEAMLINSILKIVIDGYGGILQPNLDDTGDLKHKNGKVDVCEFYKYITTSTMMLSYNNYKTNKPYHILDHDPVEIGITRKYPCVVDMNSCEEIMKNIDLPQLLNKSIQHRWTVLLKYFPDVKPDIYPPSLSEVVNVKVQYIRPHYNNLEEWCKDPNNVYIGRKGIVFINKERYPKQDSVWHNPYKIGPDGDRYTVLQKYKQHILKLLPSLDLNSLRNKKLGCWCAPEQCHGHILLELLEIC